MRVKGFESAEAFLAAPRPDGPACLLLDLTLGGMDGLALQAQLAEQQPDLPIVFISATADVPRREARVRLAPRPRHGVDVPAWRARGVGRRRCSSRGSRCLA